MKNTIGFDIIKVILWACKNIYVVGECYGINVIKYNKILLNMYRGDFGTERLNSGYAKMVMGFIHQIL